MTFSIVLALMLGGLVLRVSSVAVVTRFERGVVLRSGRLSGVVRGALPGEAAVSAASTGR